MKRRRRRPSFTPATWTVEVCPAMSHGRNYLDYFDTLYAERGQVRAVLDEGRIAVRLVRAGEPTMTYGILKINDPEFEDKVTTMKAEAEERAAALNAVGA